MNNSTKSKTILVILCVAAIIGSIIYWSNYNTKAKVTDFTEDVLTLVEQSKTKRKIEVKNVDSVEQQLNSKYIKDPLKSACTAFFKAWNAALGKQAGDFEIQIKKAAILQADFLSARAGNQLIAIILIDAIVILFFFLALFTGLLRDPQSSANRMGNTLMGTMFLQVLTAEAGDTKPPYSLSRVQLAVWLTIISCIYTYAILWDQRVIGEINNTALLLMGISAGTFTVGAILDTTEIQQNTVRHQDMQPSINFFRDILSDNNGISVHRFQNVIWTLVAIVIYFYRYSNPPIDSKSGLPTLDSTLLALTGISSATYLTLKTRENISLKAPILLKLTLDIADATLKAAIMATPEGLKNAVVKVTANTGENIKVINDATSPKDTFLAIVEPGKSLKIEVAWNGNIANAIVQLKGEVTKIPQDNPNIQPETVMLKP
jgi:DNA-binding transcriptional regulator of glucitol operon